MRRRVRQQTPTAGHRRTARSSCSCEVKPADQGQREEDAAPSQATGRHRGDGSWPSGHDEGDARPAGRTAAASHACPRSRASRAPGRSASSRARRRSRRTSTRTRQVIRIASGRAAASRSRRPRCAAPAASRPRRSPAGRLEEHQLDDSAGVPAARALERRSTRSSDERTPSALATASAHRASWRAMILAARGRDNSAATERRTPASGRRPPCARCRGSRSSWRGRRGWSSRSAPTARCRRRAARRRSCTAPAARDVRAHGPARKKHVAAPTYGSQVGRPEVLVVDRGCGAARARRC